MNGLPSMNRLSSLKYIKIDYCCCFNEMSSLALSGLLEISCINFFLKTIHYFIQLLGNGMLMDQTLMHLTGMPQINPCNAFRV